MRVSRLEIFGFKSFMERLELPLEHGITGVVGPNGCGKSNVVDALRWVLGETKASALRGGHLEDVIFNGTENLRPLGLAEVTLTIRSSTDNLFRDILERSRTSVEAFKELSNIDQAIKDGKSHKLTVLEGGLSESVTSPEENTSSSGDADDVTMTDVTDVEEASDQQEEEKSEESLTRYQWLQGVHEVQITRRLYRSGESEFFINRVPSRLKDIKDFVRVLGLGARAYTIVAQGEVSRIVSAKPEERRLVIEEAAGVSGLRDKIIEAERRLSETKVNTTRLLDVEKEVERQMNSLKRQAEKARNRATLKEELLDNERKLFLNGSAKRAAQSELISQEREEIQSSLEKEERELQKIQTEEQTLRAESLKIDVEGDGLRVKIDGIKEELHGRERKRSLDEVKIKELSFARESREKEISDVESRVTQLRERVAERQTEVQKLAEVESAFQKELAGLKELGRGELEAAEKKLTAAREAHKYKENGLRGVREDLIRMQVSFDALKARIRSASPLVQLEATLKDETLRRLIPKESKMLAEIIKVKSGYERVLEAVLAEKSAYVVVSDPILLGESLSEAFGSHDPHKKRGLGFGALKKEYVHTKQESTSTIGVPLLSLIEIGEEERSLTESLLTGVYVVETLSEVKNYFESHPQSEAIFVTKLGELCSAHSYSRFTGDGGVLMLRAEADALSIKIDAHALLVQEKERERNEASEEIKVCETQHREALKIVEARYSKIQELSNELGAARGRLGAEKRSLEVIHQDIRDSERKLETSKAALVRYDGELERVKKELQSLMSTDDASLKETLQRLTSELSAFEGRRGSLRMSLSKASESFSTLRSAVEQKRSSLSQLTLKSERVSMEQGSKLEMFVHEFGAEALEQATPVEMTEEEVREAEALASKIRARILREGDVDPESIARFEEETARYHDIKSQLKDLHEASSTLSETIIKLKATAEKRFVSTFKKVKKNFQTLIPRLFGGGKGSLELSDLENPLAGGVEILVRPPGKKPKSIDLLSGGEKALTATALIFSLFLERPSPLCVLDEVDAPLDEANLVRFIEVIKEMSVKTQFLMITHNKQSMIHADVLVGVTMQQPGASRVISVSLQDALSHVA